MGTPEQTTAPSLQDLLDDAALAGEWILDPSRSSVSLSNRSMGGLARVRGVFRQVSGNGTVSHDGLVSGTFAVATASIGTGNARRDKHLRSADFFDSDNHPDITFTVEGIRPSRRGVTVTGTLSVRGRGRPLAFDATAAVQPSGEMWLDAEILINRADFGLTWNLLGLVSMDNAITVHGVFTKR
ncbi:MAG TPA: YceI family protein [Streptosporangiaceae bacterium]|nr:YceI family protein [Streptosporangiaceae bacterium]